MENGYKSVVKYMLDIGVNLSSENRQDLEFSLCRYAACGNLDKLINLVECSISIHALDYDQRTVHHLALSQGRLGIVVFAFENRADPMVSDRWGRKAVDEAILGKHYKIQGVLLKPKPKCASHDEAPTTRFVACATTPTSTPDSISQTNSYDASNLMELIDHDYTPRKSRKRSA
jgi:hypothetical protein